MNEDAKLREQLAFHLSGHGAHIDFDAAVEGLSFSLTGKRVPNLAHTAWQLVYHLRIAQWDILEFCRNPGHVSPEYPSGYWSKAAAPSNEEQWQGVIASFREDLQAMIGLVRDTGNDLFVPFAHGSGQNLLREAILVIDHNSYHIGQLVDIRMLLGAAVRDW
ncbi:MAG: DinB family protein [Spirochaetales bacterium]|nr:DinB family protein [Spirochaetales bacterium]